jgi:hypothetical protein
LQEFAAPGVGVICTWKAALKSSLVSSSPVLPLPPAFSPDSEFIGQRSMDCVGAGASGVIYLFLAWQAWKLLQGTGDSSGGGAQEHAGTVMNLPGGSVLLEIGAIILFLAGLWQLKRAISGDFCKHLRADMQRQDWIRWMGRGGYGARGVIFIVTSFFLMSAGLSGDPSEAGGMQDALKWLSNPVNLIVAAGLALFGLFSLVEARFRQINGPPVDRMAASLT